MRQRRLADACAPSLPLLGTHTGHPTQIRGSPSRPFCSAIPKLKRTSTRRSFETTRGEPGSRPSTVSATPPDLVTPVHRNAAVGQLRPLTLPLTLFSVPTPICCHCLDESPLMPAALDPSWGDPSMMHPQATSFMLNTMDAMSLGRSSRKLNKDSSLSPHAQRLVRPTSPTRRRRLAIDKRRSDVNIFYQNRDRTKSIFTKECLTEIKAFEKSIVEYAKGGCLSPASAGCGFKVMQAPLTPHSSPALFFCPRPHFFAYASHTSHSAFLLAEILLPRIRRRVRSSRLANQRVLRKNAQRGLRCWGGAGKVRRYRHLAQHRRHASLVGPGRNILVH